jgi:MoaA/NifB/PqqE/SkfB family radical SAM enzyme
MDTALAKRAISEIAANKLCEKITFHVMGEPTLHPHFFEILEHAEVEGQKVGLTTNGAVLGGKIGRKLLEYKLHQVDVSLQTPDEESFSLRGAGSLTFKRYLDSIMDFFSKYHVRYPDSIFKLRLMNTIHNKKQMADPGNTVAVIDSTSNLRQIVKTYSSMIYKLLDKPIRNEMIFDKKIQSLVNYKWNVIEVIPNVFLETYLLSGWGNAFEDDLTPSDYGYCYGMKDHFSILYNGDVVLCCVDYDGKTAFGNIGNSSLKDVLSSSPLKEIMEGFKKFRFVHSYCKRCQGSHSLLSRMVKPVASILALKLLKGFFYKKTSLFER